MARKYPPGVRLLLDLARAGKCGEHAPDEHAAHAAHITGEWNPDRASSDAFLDLAWALGNLSGDSASNELCAGALAEAWRRTYPFRRAKDGDPLDVLLPHPDDAGAARALDRARALPRPPWGLVRLGRAAGGVEYWVEPEPYDPNLTRVLASEALAVLDAVPPCAGWWAPRFKAAIKLYQAFVIEVLASAGDARKLVKCDGRPYMFQALASLRGEVYTDLEDVPSERAEPVISYIALMNDAAMVVDVLIKYIALYAQAFRGLGIAETSAEMARDAWENFDPTDALEAAHGHTKATRTETAREYADDVERFRGLFPDLYPEGERRLPWRDEVG